MKKILLTIVHYLTFLDLIAKVARRVASKFMPGWVVDIGYYVLIGIDYIATLIENKYKRTYDPIKEPFTVEELKELDPFKVKRHYRRSKSLQGIVDRAKVDWLRKYDPMKVQTEIEKIRKKREE